ncbi:MAG: signal peptidase I [Dehalococcoidia bacterium]
MPSAASSLPWEEEPAAPPIPAWARRPSNTFEPDPWARLEANKEANLPKAPDDADPWRDVVEASGYDQEPTAPSGLPSPVFRGFGHRIDRSEPAAVQPSPLAPAAPPAPALTEPFRPAEPLATELHDDPVSEFRVQRTPRLLDSGLPEVAARGDEVAPDDDTLLRAFESHATRGLGEPPQLAAEPRALDVPPSLDSLLGRQGADLLEEVSSTPIERPLFARPSQSPIPNAAVDVGPRAEHMTVQHRSGWNFADEDPAAAVALTSAAAGAGTFEAAPAKSRARGKVVVRELVETGLLAILVFLAVRASFQNFKVDGTSMFPTLEDGQFLIVNKLVYSEVDVEKLSRFIPFLDAGDDPKRNVFHGPQRGEIVVLQDPRKPDTDLIKRVIGLPGDTIEIIDGKVYINDYYLEEPYIKRTWHYTGPRTVIPPGHFFVMGDNRDNSLDSRSPLVGLVPEELMIGKAFVSYWPSSVIGLAPNADPKITQIKSPNFAQAK